MGGGGEGGKKEKEERKNPTKLKYFAALVLASPTFQIYKNSIFALQDH